MTVPSTPWRLTAAKCSLPQSESKLPVSYSCGSAQHSPAWLTDLFTFSDRTVKIWEAKGSLEEGVY